VESCPTFYRPIGKGVDREFTRGGGYGRMNRIYGKANHEPELLEKATNGIIYSEF